MIVEQRDQEMRVDVAYGQKHLELEASPSQLVPLRPRDLAPDLPDVARAMRSALEEPLGFPALRRALTPDDHVAIVLDEGLAHESGLLVPLLEHLVSAGVAPNAVTIVFARALPGPQWLATLPAEFRNVHLELHDPSDRQRLAYLATTRRGRRIYVNRTVVDAEQSVVVARRTFDPLLGYSGCEGSLYPALSDLATWKEMARLLSLADPEQHTWPAQQEAAEVCWLLGAPFMVQVIEGAGTNPAHILGGTAESCTEGLRLLNARWRIEVESPADTVVAAVAGPESRDSFADLARALACAARVVKPDGRIVLLSDWNPQLGEGVGLIRQTEDVGEALELLRDRAPSDVAGAFQWAQAAQTAKVYLLSGLADEIAEELFTVPLEHAGQVQRLVSQSGSCLIIPNADKTLARVV